MEPWKNFSYNERKFRALPINSQHKHAATACKAAYLNPSFFQDYQKLEQFLSLPPIAHTKEALSNRYHEHLRLAHTSLKENHFLPSVSHFDKLEGEPFLPIDIYLDHLRSAHNIGSIIRTTEAFRLGSIHISGHLPPMEKLEKTAMGSIPFVTCHIHSHLEALRRPLIAIETHKDARPIYGFTFPSSFSLLLGNEEYGLSEESLKSADTILRIPLYGAKNSLNVASAFTALAFEIRRQLAL